MVVAAGALIAVAIVIAVVGLIAGVINPQSTSQFAIIYFWIGLLTRAINPQSSSKSAIIYFVMLFTFGIKSLQKGHLRMFIVGLLFPFVWIISALMPRKAR